MRYLSLIVLAACTSHTPVVMWASARTDGEDRIEVRENGNVTYTIVNNGVEEQPSSLMLTKDQLNELGDMLHSQHACELAHDPGYTAGPGETQTTLTLAFPDQHCKVTLWNGEWQRGRAHDIAETMRSMRPRRR